MTAETLPETPIFYIEDEDHAHEPGGATLLGFWIYAIAGLLRPRKISSPARHASASPVNS